VGGTPCSSVHTYDYHVNIRRLYFPGNKLIRDSRDNISLNFGRRRSSGPSSNAKRAAPVLGFVVHRSIVRAQTSETNRYSSSSWSWSTAIDWGGAPRVRGHHRRQIDYGHDLCIYIHTHARFMRIRSRYAQETDTSTKTFYVVIVLDQFR